MVYLRGFLYKNEFCFSWSVTEPETGLLTLWGRRADMYPHAGGIAVSWLMYGSSHYGKRPIGLVIDQYVWRADNSYMRSVRTFGNPRLMKCAVNPYHPVYLYGQRMRMGIVSMPLSIFTRVISVYALTTIISNRRKGVCVKLLKKLLRAGARTYARDI